MNADSVDPGKQASKEGELARREIRICASCGTEFLGDRRYRDLPRVILLGSVGATSLLREARAAARCDIRTLPRYSILARAAGLLLRDGVCGRRDGRQFHQALLVARR